MKANRTKLQFVMRLLARATNNASAEGEARTAFERVKEITADRSYLQHDDEADDLIDYLFESLEAVVLARHSAAAAQVTAEKAEKERRKKEASEQNERARRAEASLKEGMVREELLTR